MAGRRREPLAFAGALVRSLPRETESFTRHVWAMPKGKPLPTNINTATLGTNPFKKKLASQLRKGQKLTRKCAHSNQIERPANDLNHCI